MNPLSLSSIPTPRVFVDREKLAANIAAMQALASHTSVKLRPHAKTHKCPAIARWQIDAGAVGICCAKLGEAEVFVDAGVGDIRLPYPVNPANADRVRALMGRTRLSIIVDDLDVARAWSASMAPTGRRLDVLVKVDVGFHRCGVDPERPQTFDMIRGVADLAGLRFLGLLSHAGHGYLAQSPEELEEIAEREMAILVGLAARLSGVGVRVTEISVGATPTARFIARHRGATEMRPGNYVFFDRTQVGLGAASLADCSLGIVSTVVSRPVAGRVVFDAGSKTLTSDGVRGFGTMAGFGLVTPALEASDPDPSIVIERLSEEHAVARVQPDCTLKPGDRVRILPNHACVVANLTDELLLVEGNRVVDRLSVAARGKNW